MSSLMDKLEKLVELKNEIEKLRKSKMLKDEFDDCAYWEVSATFEECTEKDGTLYSKDGEELCDGGLEDGKYYAHQTTGYGEDDYYGTMYYKTNKSGVFISVIYEC